MSVRNLVTVLSLVIRSLTQTVIAGDRFLGIVFPLREHISTRKTARAVVLISVTWLTSALVALPIFIFREERRRQWSDHLEIWCDEAWPQSLVEASLRTFGRRPDNLYFLCICLFLFFLPIALMTLAYALVIRKLVMTSASVGHVYASSEQEKKNRRITNKVRCRSADSSIF